MPALRKLSLMVLFLALCFPAGLLPAGAAPAAPQASASAPAAPPAHARPYVPAHAQSYARPNARPYARAHATSYARPYVAPKPSAPAHVAPKPSAPAPAAPQASALAAVPDYGGRDSGPLAVSAPSADAAPNPAAQAGRALEALVVVLGGVVGVVFLLKRFDLVRPGLNGKAARIAAPAFGRLPKSGAEGGVAVLSSQTLPGGAMLHVVRVGGKNVLLAATAQSVTNVAEWSASEAEATDAGGSFDNYLARAEPAPVSGIAAAHARLRSLLPSHHPEEPS